MLRYLKYTTLHIFFPDYDCTHDLPTIYESYGSGCPGAVYSNGNPSRDYCQDKSWWKACCKWNGSQCIPKDHKIIAASTHSNLEYGRSCYDGPLQADMNKYLNEDGNWQATDKFTKVTLFDAEWAAGNF